MFAQGIAGLLNHFSLVMLILALVISFFSGIVSAIPINEQMFRWVALLAVGFTGVFTFIMHAFFPETSAAAIGWSTSPFQYEVAIADLTVGVLGLVAFNASVGFRAATVVADIIWQWGDAIGHIHQMITEHNFSSGNAGSWFWLDIIIPLILLITFIKMRSPTHLFR